MDWSKIDRSYLEGLKVGKIAQVVLKELIEQGASCGIISRSDIADFKDSVWTQRTFGVQYALLSKNRDIISNSCRYYDDEIICYGETLYLTNYWKPDRHKDRLIDWILNWIALHGWATLKRKTGMPKLSNIIKGPKQKPIYDLDYGDDEESGWVYYNKNVEDGEKVPDLCRKLQTEYLEFIYHFAEDLLSQLYGKDFPEPIKVELCKECPSKIYLFNDEYIARKINEVVDKCGSMDAKTYAKISRLCMRINGEFIDGSTPKIKIYYNQFSAKSEDEYMAKISKTLAHEFLHYLEFAYCKIKKSEYYQDERVSEALADFFGVAYSIKRGNDLSRRGVCGTYRVDVAEARHDLWEELEGSGWPYAFALHFYTVNGILYDFSPNFIDYQVWGSIGKFVEVFNSTPDVVDAYDKLKKL